MKTFIAKIEKATQIIECHAVLGEGSHLLKAIVKKTESLEKLLSEIQSSPGLYPQKQHLSYLQ